MAGPRELFTFGEQVGFYQWNRADSIDFICEYRLRNFFAKFS
jgi:hypothetical protein